MPIKTIWIDGKEEIRCSKGCREKGGGGWVRMRDRNQIGIRWSRSTLKPGANEPRKPSHLRSPGRICPHYLCNLNLNLSTFFVSLQKCGPSGAHQGANCRRYRMGMKCEDVQWFRKKKKKKEKERKGKNVILKKYSTDVHF